MTVWIVGAGRMAEAYGKVLEAGGVDFLVVGRGEETARGFTERTGHPCRPGGLDAALAELAPPEAAIVATDVDSLADNGLALLAAGCRRILIEKPGGVTPAEIAALAEATSASGADVRLGYNRRFYASVLAAEAAIAEDGGAVSMNFEFTESVDVVAGLPYAPEVKENWLLANSTHVIDTAFHLAGRPKRLFSAVEGQIAWHSRAARFAGTGLTENGVLFVYHADWDAPGRWGIEINTRRRRLILRPMEQLHVQKRGAFTVEPMAIDDDLDRRFKPGLHRQMAAFLDGEDAGRLLTIGEHLARVRTIYESMYRPWGLQEIPT
ncbi:MAG: Gfo/Idh/MocA family oxidoreductase [Siculibacillus sp.]|nr:Gfo/Idh/MocA family oxidoreductase [Siculibacillus sp.]